MVPLCSVPSWFWSRIELSKYNVNIRMNEEPNLWSIWKQHFDPVMLFANDQCFAFSILWDNKLMHIAIVYASIVPTI